MNVVDSSAWLEYFADAPNADYFATVIEKVDKLIVPAITIYEVFKRVAQQSTHSDALQAIGLMQQGTLIEVNTEIAICAAQLSLELQLPMADSLILATARLYKATVWTQDADFEGIDGVNFKAKKSKTKK